MKTPCASLPGRMCLRRSRAARAGSAQTAAIIARNREKGKPNIAFDIGRDSLYSPDTIPIPPDKGTDMRKALIILAVLLAFFIVLIRLLMWNSSGGFFDFLAGQMEPSPRLTQYDISLTGSSAEPFAVSVSIDTASAIGEVDPEYLSFAIDTSQLVGGKWWNPKADRVELGGGEKHAPVFDFNRPRLDLLASALAPAYLRMGGTEADKVYYHLAGEPAASYTLPAGFTSVMTRRQWDNLAAFTRRNNLKLVFTINTGPATRRADGSWDSANAETLLAYAAKKGDRVAIWELGNELNLLWYDAGPGSMVSIGQYRKDLEAARHLVRKYHPRSRFTGHSSAFWPILGEPLSLFFGMIEDYVEEAGDVVDTIGWHYYPQQSRRGPIASRKAYPQRLLDPETLDEAAHWAEYIKKLRDQYAPGKPIWLGESGNAQFGGEPGVSDVYISGLWWLDELGLLARHGHRVVVRQTLCGSNYGMIEDDLTPRPDYWNSLLWKRLMGTRVFEAKASGEGFEKLRVYAHRARGRDSSVCVLLINLHHEKNATVSFPGMKGRGFELYAINAPHILGKAVLLNGERLSIKGNALPSIRGVKVKAREEPRVTLHPLSYAFVVFEGR